MVIEVTFDQPFIFAPSYITLSNFIITGVPSTIGDYMETRTVTKGHWPLIQSCKQKTVDVLYKYLLPHYQNYCVNVYQSYDVYTLYVY